MSRIKFEFNVGLWDKVLTPMSISMTLMCGFDGFEPHDGIFAFAGSFEIAVGCFGPRWDWLCVGESFFDHASE